MELPRARRVEAALDARVREAAVGHHRVTLAAVDVADATALGEVIRSIGPELPLRGRAHTPVDTGRELAAGSARAAAEPQAVLS